MPTTKWSKISGQNSRQLGGWSKKTVVADLGCCMLSAIFAAVSSLELNLYQINQWWWGSGVGNRCCDLYHENRRLIQVCAAQARDPEVM